MSNNQTSGNNPIAEGIGEFLKGVPWARLTVHMIPVIIIVFYTGNWLKEIYMFNVVHNLVDTFPRTKDLWTYFISTIVILGVNLLLDIRDSFKGKPAIIQNKSEVA